MDARTTGNGNELSALLVAPDRTLAERFVKTLPEARAFQVLAELKTYPHEQVLDIRLRQLKPDVLLLDVATNLELAGELIRFTAAAHPGVQVVGLHNENDPETILRALRAGASEFLHAPFDAAMQLEAAARINRLRRPESSASPELGKVIVFSSAKPGSGASTLATQTAFAVRKATGKRLLLADFDLLGGTIAFYLKLTHNYSLVDALSHSGPLDAAIWNALTVNHAGVDILPAPEMPSSETVDPGRLHEVLEYARLLYDWVIVDLPTVFQRVSLLAVSESDWAFLVSTAELPSLHLTRRAVTLLSQLGIDKDRYQVVVNRMGKREGLGGSDIEKILNCPVQATCPSDYFSLHRVVTHGQPLGSDCELGRAIDRLAGRITGPAARERRGVDAPVGAKPVLSET